VLNVEKSKKLYPEGFRRIKYYDKAKGNMLVFLTNNMTAGASDVVQLYKSRWAVEVFFKLIKQNLQIKTLWGHSENAVRTHVWVAICTYLIVAYLKFQIKSELSIPEIMQILGISCFDRTAINELLTKSQINQNVNEQFTLFNIN
jgi:IS4 transposase